MKRGTIHHASWRELLAAPPPAAHVVQLYDSDEFLAAAAAHFAAEGLSRGEAVMLTGTPEHLRGIRRGLADKGVDADAALRSGQLAMGNAREGAARLMVDATVDAARFRRLALDKLARMQGDERFEGTRWWGEMTYVLWQQGDTRAALAVEDLCEAAARERGIRLFCSFCCDRFDARGYDGILKDLCARHSHLVPAQDYVRHRLAVNRAVTEVIGDIRGPLLQSLLSWKGVSCDLPSSQALLFWIREALPERFADVLSRAKGYQAEESG